MIDTLEVKLSLNADAMARIEERIVSDETAEKVYAVIERALTTAPGVYAVNRETLRSATVEAIVATVSDLIKLDLA